DARTDAGGPADDSGSVDASADAPADAPAYLACMNASGAIDPALKACKSDSDCIIKEEQTDCCGSIRYVGLASSVGSRFDVCEAAWLAHFPACGCDSGRTETEDGSFFLPGQDAGTMHVRCTNFTASGGMCMTLTVK